jgi:hypothetical protein
MEDELLKLTQCKRRMELLLHQCNEAIVKLLALRMKENFPKNYRRRISTDDICKIRTRRYEGEAIKTLAYEFRISTSYVHSICNRKYIESRFKKVKTYES